MAQSNESVRGKLKELRAAFSEQLPKRIRQIEDAWAALLRDGWDPERAENLARLLHTLAGTAGTFGFSAARGAARNMEAQLKSIIKSGAVPDKETMPSIGDHLTALKAGTSESGKREFIEPVWTASAKPETLIPQAAARPLKNTVFFFADDPLSIESLVLQIRYYGYEAVTFGTLDGLSDSLKTLAPLLVIMDLSEGGIPCIQEVARIQQNRTPRIPVIFFSTRAGFDSRLEAVRSGGDAYFTKPVDIGKLVDMLDVLSQRRPLDPYRILIIDDDPLLADYHATVLRQAGMSTGVVTDPVRALQSMADFRPELILMDVYMPGCSGIELAKVIRQDETYIDIPIVFLSSETDIKRQLQAMSRGADDFLTKPIQPEHLVTSITLRADRHRALRSFMLYDGLTGLLNHTRTKEQLDIEIARLLRQNYSALTFALIDIDHFKTVNDTYGHPVGDQVIKSLSRLLRQRLRTTDTVGRYGGEEFAIILADTDAQNAIRILNELREDFGKIRHKSELEAFSATFSCGAAVYAPGISGSRLIDAADKALYEAKRSGRNRVVMGSDV